MKTLCKILVIVPLLFLFNGCEDLDSILDPQEDPPECDIVKLEKYDEEFGEFAKFVLTAQNVDNGAAAYEVGCTIKLKSGNTIIESGFAHFGTLDPGEGAVEEALFPDITDHSEYDYAVITLYWFDAYDNYYDRIINYN